MVIIHVATENPPFVDDLPLESSMKIADGQTILPGPQHPTAAKSASTMQIKKVPSTSPP